MLRSSFNLTVALLTLVVSAHADITATWNGTTGNWTDAARWSTGVFPNNSAPNFYDAVINAGTVTLNQGIAINQLTLGGGTLAGASALALAEGVQWNGGTLAVGSVTLGASSASVVAGGATFSSGTIFGGGGATFTVQFGATLIVLDGANFFAQASSPAYTLTNAGTLIARNPAGPGFTTIDAALINSGALRVENTGAAHTLSLAGGGTLGGSVFLDTNTTLELGGTLAISANTAFTGAGTAVVAGIVTLGGSGITVQNLAIAVGELRLAGNALSVAGGASIEDNGKLVVQIRGLGALADKLAIGGALTAYGTLAVTLGGGFTPAPGDEFDILDFTSFTGGFAALQLPALPANRFWRTDKLTTEGKLAISIIPATFAEWQLAYGAGVFNADDDKDGIPNGLEFALALLPNNGNGANGPISLPRVTIAANHVRLHFEIPDPGATDITLLVQASDDLGITDPWTTIATKTGTAAWTGPAVVTLASAVGGKIPVIVADTKLVSATPKRFLRLRASH